MWRHTRSHRSVWTWRCWPYLGSHPGAWPQDTSRYTAGLTRSLACLHKFQRACILWARLGLRRRYSDIGGFWRWSLHRWNCTGWLLGHPLWSSACRWLFRFSLSLSFCWSCIHAWSERLLRLQRLLARQLLPTTIIAVTSGLCGLSWNFWRVFYHVSWFCSDSWSPRSSRCWCGPGDPGHHVRH